MRTTCPVCGGRGWIQRRDNRPAVRCEGCRGRGQIRDREPPALGLVLSVALGLVGWGVVIYAVLRYAF